MWSTGKCGPSPRERDVELVRPTKLDVPCMATCAFSLRTIIDWVVFAQILLCVMWSVVKVYSVSAGILVGQAELNGYRSFLCLYCHLLPSLLVVTSGMCLSMLVAKCAFHLDDT